MSGATQTAGNGAASPAMDGLTPEEIESSARALGWKPKNEFRGPPDKWRPAETFMEATTNPAILANNLRVMSDRYRTLENTHRTTTQQLTAKLDEATGMVGTLTERFRTVEERTYARARKELLTERDKAISEGDTAAVHRLDADVQELDAGKPPPKTAAPAQPAAPAAPTLDPEIAAWSARNDWFFKDPEMQASANAASAALRANAETAGLPIGEHLARVDAIVKRTFPEKFAAPRTAVPANGAADVDDDAEPPAVETPNSGGAGRSQGSRNRRDFNSMPREAKTAFNKYKEIIGRKVEENGRVKPLTEAEWARDYWGQFEDV